MRKPLVPTLAILALLAALLAFRACSVPPIRNLEPRSGPVVVLGDSLAVGVGSAGGRRGYVALLQERLGVELVNKGVSGNTTEDGLARLEGDVLALKPALVVLELGGNDFLRRVDPDDTFANLEAMVRRSQEAGAAVLVLGTRSGVFSDKHEKRFREVARRNGAAYVPNLLEGVFAQPALMYDSIHPNDAGYAKVAERLEPTFRDLLTRLGKKPR